MSADPILVLQLQRMGDLILTFPLLLFLRRQYPQHPVWVVAESQFFTPLMPLAPNVVFFPPETCAALAQKNFFLVINLSNRKDATLCAYQAKAENKLGLVQSKQDTKVLGFWNLYRLGLTQNNHHNTFHWSDLYRLDALKSISGIRWTSPSPSLSNNKRIALVIGASEAAKRPDIAFWVGLAKKLAQQGYPPILIGGQAETEMGNVIAQQAHLPAANYCGKLKLDEVAALLRETVLCITPDTGPMHLADWMGVRVLNLSMGPVHAPETGPSSPGQWILRARLSCVGCWQCSHKELKCKQKFYSSQIAKLVFHILEEPEKANTACPPQLQLLQSRRDGFGLYAITDLQPKQSCRTIVDDFWRSAFLSFAGNDATAGWCNAYERLASHYPKVAQKLKTEVRTITQYCAQGFKKQTELQDNFWQSRPLLVRFLAGHIHMYLQNANWSSAAWHTVMERLALVAKNAGSN